MKQFFVYIMASGKNGTLYIGVTSDLQKRVVQHKEEFYDGFSKRYNVKKIVYYEVFPDPLSAIAREKCLKRWKREWKIRLVTEKNHQWEDLGAYLEK